MKYVGQRRKMKLKNLIKRIVLYGSLAIAFNYGLIPCYYSVSKPRMKEMKNKKIQAVCKTDDYLQQIKQFESDEAFFYLRAAHMITSKFLSSPIYFKTLQDPKYEKHKEHMKGDKEEEAALDGIADCVYFSVFTFSNFNYLCDKLGKPELKDKVRYCEGRVKTLTGEFNHVWLEVKAGDKWVDFDPSCDFFSEYDTLDFKLKYDTFSHGKGFKTYYITSKDGKLESRIGWGNALKGKENFVKQLWEARVDKGV